MTAKDIKPQLNKIVAYKKSKYYFTGAILRLNDSGFYYQAELKDLKQNSIVIAKLEDIIIE